MDMNGLRRFGGQVAREATVAASRLAATPPLPPHLHHGLNASMLLLHDDPDRHPALETGLAFLAAQGDAEADEADDGTPGDIVRAVVLHLHLAAFLERYESLPPRLWGACEHHLPEAVLPARQVERFSDTPPRPDRVDRVLWNALCLHDQARALGRDIDTEMVDGIVHHALTAFEAVPTSGDGPLSRWSVVRMRALHALANLALHRRNRTWARSLRTMTLALDPRPSQPWALFARAWSGPTDFAVGGAGSCAASTAGGAMALMLLADAVAAMRCFAP